MQRTEIGDSEIEWLNMTVNQTAMPSIYIDRSIPSYLTVVLIVSYVLLMPFIITGNLLVIVAYFKFQTMKTVTHMLICCLAICDITVGVFSIPMIILVKMVPRLIDDGQLLYILTRKWICIPWIFSYVIPCSCSIMTLLAIAACLLTSIQWPFKFSTWVTHYRGRIVILCIWVYVIALCIPLFLLNKNRDNEMCMMENLPWQYFKVVIISHITIPYVLMILIYIAVYVTVRKMNKRCQQMMQGFSISANQRVNIKIAKFMCIAIGIFFVCWMPVVVMYPLASYYDGQELFNVIYYYATWLAFASSAANPILYSAKNQDYRKAFKSLLTCGSSKSGKVKNSMPNEPQIISYKT